MLYSFPGRWLFFRKPIRTGAEKQTVITLILKNAVISCNLKTKILLFFNFWLVYLFIYLRNYFFFMKKNLENHK